MAKWLVKTAVEPSETLKAALRAMEEQARMQEEYIRRVLRTWSDIQADDDVRPDVTIER